MIKRIFLGLLVLLILLFLIVYVSYMSDAFCGYKRLLSSILSPIKPIVRVEKRLFSYLPLFYPVNHILEEGIHRVSQPL